MMIVDGMVASLVTVSDKGVRFKVLCKELGDTFGVFIPADNVNGEQHLHMCDPVKVDFNEFFLAGKEVCIEVKRVTLDRSKKVT